MAFRSRQYLLSEVKPGMVLGADVLSVRGKVMLSANTILTERLINRLACWGYERLAIIDDYSDSELIRAKRQAERIAFNAKYQETVNLVKESFEQIQYFKSVPLQKMYDLTENEVVMLIATPGVLSYLHGLRDVDHYTFQHSVNVAVIVGTLSKWLSFEEEWRDFIVAGLLHDVGKMAIPPAILNKPDKLLPTEMEIMKRHSLLGYELLKKAGVSSQTVLTGVWQHHERLDGSGYPRGASGEEISIASRILAIADIYDAMTSERVYQSSSNPFVVIRTLFENMFDKLDAAFCTVFLNNLKDYFLGSVIKLQDGRLAEVIYMDWISWDRITVKTMDGEYVELKDQKKLEFVQIMNP